MPKSPHVHDVKRQLSGHGISVRHQNGEFRVNHSGASEHSAYYTDDATDAVNTGLAMARRRLELETERGEHKPVVGGHQT